MLSSPADLDFLFSLLITSLTSSGWQHLSLRELLLFAIKFLTLWSRHAIDLKLTGVVVDEILKHPEKQFYKTNFFKDTLSIGDVDDGDNSTPFR